MSSLLPLVALVVLLIIGELIFRRIPGAGGILYNLSGTLGGVVWVLVGAFLVWGGSYILGGLIIIAGVNIHRSNFRIAKRTFGDGRSRLNG